jgi:transcriptional regulator with XRE-family HTH domain
MLSPMPLDFEKIRALRMEAGLSMQAAADLAGFKSRQQWHQIESGERTNIELNTLESIAKALSTKNSRIAAKDLLK